MGRRTSAAFHKFGCVGKKVSGEKQTAAKVEEKKRRIWPYNPPPDESLVYKTLANGYELKIHVFYPVNMKASLRRPAAVFFHGGSLGSNR
jgi:hypothetical protein